MQTVTDPILEACHRCGVVECRAAGPYCGRCVQEALDVAAAEELFDRIEWLTDEDPQEDE